jgi:hypothetical protein
MTTRDYRKFLHADGRLNVRLLPRPVYLQILGRYRRIESVIDDVFEDLRWSWDLNKRTRAAVADGRSVSRADLADEIVGEMEDRDWWKATAAFEEHLISHFGDDPKRWSDVLDEVYDWQEQEGWQDRHYSKYLE